MSKDYVSRTAKEQPNKLVISQESIAYTFNSSEKTTMVLDLTQKHYILIKLYAIVLQYSNRIDSNTTFDKLTSTAHHRLGPIHV